MFYNYLIFVIFDYYVLLLQAKLGLSHGPTLFWDFPIILLIAFKKFKIQLYSLCYIYNSFFTHFTLLLYYNRQYFLFIRSNFKIVCINQYALFLHEQYYFNSLSNHKSNYHALYSPSLYTFHCSNLSLPF